MRAPTAQILETALALHRAPGERFRLRERPLPDGIVHVLEIASGSPQALSSAVAAIGHDQQELLEAVRFYLEQVLFAAEDADAYRVLGLTADAPQDSIRIHHRWLQRWLHPDRAQGDATVFATRVNQAWSQLRTPELRHDYDVRLAEARLAGAGAPLAADTVQRWEQAGMPPPEDGGRRSRWLLGAALAACAVLAVLIFRHQETIAPWEQHEGSDPVATDPGPAMDDRDVGVLAAELMKPAAQEAEAGTGNREQGMEPVPRLAVVAPEVAPVPTARRAPRMIPVGSVVSSVSTIPAEPEPAPKPVAKPEPKAIAADAAPAKPAPVPIDPKVLVERMRQAERRVAQVTAYLAARPGAAPLWNDPQTEAAARQARERIKPRSGATLELIRPQWRLQHDDASVSAGYKVRSDGGAGQGRLDVQLVWREGLWLVRGVELAPAA